MKGYTKDNVLYVFPQEVGEIPSVGAGVTEILVQQEDLAAWKTANSDYASIMKAYNYNMMTVQKKVWADHVNDNITVSPELAWSAESATAQIGETNSYPTLTNPHSVTVTYSSSDTEKATIDQSTGTITLVAAGNTTISAVFAGNDTYDAQTVTYTLTVVAAKVSPNLAWSAESATVTIGADDNVFPTLSNPHSVSVWYTTNDDCIDINQETGEITLLSAGTADVDAIFDGDDTYEEQDVTYELTVNAASVDYENQYFTIKGVNEPVTISLNESQSEPIYISTNNGSTWQELDSDYTVNSAIFKHSGTLTISNGPLFTVDDDYIVEGNIMSLLYGDNFVDETDLTGKDYAFCNMFAGDDHIISAENLILPATTLVESCYDSMFSGCTSLTTAPELPATTLTTGCYQDMFRDCTSLNYIKCLATDINAISCTVSWVDGVAASGTFVKNSSMTEWTTGNDGIPSGWTVQDAAEEYE